MESTRKDMKDGASSTVAGGVLDSPRTISVARATEETTNDLSLEEYVNLQLSGSYRRCIYKVPERIRKIREEAYTPRLVSIGPLHHGAISLQSGERDKIKYANSFFSKFPNPEKKNFLDEAKRLEKRAREYYDDINHLNLSSNEFTYMILVDGIFIIEFLVRNIYTTHRETNDQIFQKEWICKEILRDMILIENQLPFFVIDYLFNRLKEVRSLNISLIELIHEVFRSPLQLRYRELHKLMPSVDETHHLVYIFYFNNILAGPSVGVKWKGGKLIDNSSATELQEVGVKFVGVTRDCLYDIEFDTKTGVLKIPRLVVNQWTYSLLGNLNAFEHCQFNGTVISSYIIFMDNLIDTPADVDLLYGSGIIETQSSSKEVCDFFNNLHERTALDDHKFLLSDLCKDLNAYSRDYWHEWKAYYHKSKHMLKQDYFSNPWTIISVIAAASLLILTIIQTVCSVMGVVKDPRENPTPAPPPL